MSPRILLAAFLVAICALLLEPLAVVAQVRTDVPAAPEAGADAHWATSRLGEQQEAGDGPVPGDFTFDGRIDPADLRAFAQILKDPVPFVEAHPQLGVAEMLQLGDLNGDQRITNADLIALYEQLVHSGAVQPSRAPEAHRQLLALGDEAASTASNSKVTAAAAAGSAGGAGAPTGGIASSGPSASSSGGGGGSSSSGGAQLLRAAGGGGGAGTASLFAPSGSTTESTGSSPKPPAESPAIGPVTDAPSAPTSPTSPIGPVVIGNPKLPQQNAPIDLTAADLGLPSGPAGVTPPGSREVLTLAVTNDDKTPAIAAWSELVQPDETLVATGVNLAGVDMAFWTPGRQADFAPLRSLDDRLQAVIPADMPHATALVWPVASPRIGKPIRINGPIAWWCWPGVVFQNEPATLRIFGKGLAVPTGQPAVYLEGPGLKPRALAVTKSTPYTIEATLPRNLATGTFKAYVHNGTGGTYGWSEPVTFEVQPPIPNAKVVIDVESLRRDGEDDAALINRAIRECQKQGGGTVQLAAKTYELTTWVRIPEGPPVTLRGAGMGQWNTAARTFAGGGTLLLDQFLDKTRSRVVELEARRSSLEDLTIQGLDEGRPNLVRMAGSNQLVRRVRLFATGYGHALLSMAAENGQHQISACEIHSDRFGIGVSTTIGVRVDGCSFVGYYSHGGGTDADAIRVSSGGNLVIENNIATSFARRQGKILGRLLVISDNGIRNSYIANNRINDFGTHPSVEGVGTNASEAILFHIKDVDGIRDSQGGVYRVSSASAHSVDMQPPLTVQGPPEDGWILSVVSGRGAGQWRRVTNLSAGRITVEPRWSVVPDSGSWVLARRVFQQHLVVGNAIDGSPSVDSHRSAGVFFFHNAFGNVVAGNTVADVGLGVVLGGDHDTPCSWNLVRGNDFTRIRGATGDTGTYAVALSEHVRTHPGQFQAFTYWGPMGNAFRSNRGHEVEAVCSIGWRFMSDTPDSRYRASLRSGIGLTVVEDNAFDQPGRGVEIGAPANWTLVRNNRSISTDAPTPLRSPGGEARVIELLESTAQAP